MNIKVDLVQDLLVSKLETEVFGMYLSFYHFFVLLIRARIMIAIALMPSTIAMSTKAVP